MKSRYCLDVVGFYRCDYNVNNTFGGWICSTDFLSIYIQNIPFYKRKREGVKEECQKRLKLWWFVKGITIYVQLLLLFLFQDESVICGSHRHAVLRDPCVKCLKRCVLEGFVLELPVTALREYLCVLPVLQSSTSCHALCSSSAVVRAFTVLIMFFSVESFMLTWTWLCEMRFQ